MSSMYELATRQIVVRVDPEYLDTESAPDEDYFVWTYRVQIQNCGSETIQVRSRKWTIIDGQGITQEVEGDGIVGQQPVLKPGDGFEYSSGAPLSTPSGIMGGTYTVQTDLGEVFEIRIPTFSLDSPYETRVLH
jgi:ApaG protein